VPDAAATLQLAEWELVRAFAHGWWKRLRSRNPAQQPGDASRSERALPRTADVLRASLAALTQAEMEAAI